MKNVSQIRQTLIDLPEYRFYSSSLLIIYEGEPGPVSSFEEDKTDNSMDCEQFDQAISADNNKEIVKQIEFNSYILFSKLPVTLS